MFFDQKDDNGDPISITPGLLLVPTSLKTIADQLHVDLSHIFFLERDIPIAASHN